MTPTPRFLPLATALLIAGLTVAAARGQDAAEGWVPALARLPVRSAANDGPVAGDWLVRPVAERAAIYRRDRRDEIVLANGLVRRVFRLAPNAATVAYDNLMTGAPILRAVKPEARIEIGGVTYDIGGLTGQPDRAWLAPEWVDGLTADPRAFTFVGFVTGPTTERFAWKRVRHAAAGPWPPPGVALTLEFAAPAGVPELRGLRAFVHYELYDGLPLLSKWLTLRNDTGTPVRLARFTSELLAAVEPESAVEEQDLALADLHVETDFAFGGSIARGANRHGVHWVSDPDYDTQVNYRRKTPCLLEVRPSIGPDVVIGAGEEFESFRAFELAYDSTERERRGLAMRRMVRAIAPWVTENPLMLHARSADPAAVRLAIDQCAAVGFEMVILSFGSGFDLENEDPAYRRQLRELAVYARGQGIELGGYSLLSSRSIGPETDVIDVQSGRPGGATHGSLPCLGSRWGADYFRKLYDFYRTTGFTLLEHDGSYPGDACASADHPGHRGYDDSQWQQWLVISRFYRWCRAEGIYLNVPDHYFLSGSNKTGMGYRETNWSLPRELQVIHARQNIYDGTWEKTPTMGWMFVPLTEYQGGGAAATIEPLREHLDTYEAHLANCLTLGVQACYRGPRLYDAEPTRELVARWVAFFKAHRDILESDLIHLRRADGRDIDGLMHVNPALPEKALAVFFNPLDRPASRTFRLPLYYAGLTDRARLRERDGAAREVSLDRGFAVEVKVDLGPRARTWFIIE